MNKLHGLPDLATSSSREAAEFLLAYLRTEIPQSSTKLSLHAGGYPEDGDVERTIRTYRRSASSPAHAAIKALETGCGNCQELAYAGALVLRAAKYQGSISIGQYGLNHQFLFVDDLIVDPWAEMICSSSDWQGNLFAYGGSIREGTLYGRLIPWDHDELEDEEPEIIESIPLDYYAFIEGIEDNEEKPSLGISPLPLELFLLGKPPQKPGKTLNNDLASIEISTDSSLNLS
ncbi:hypothetical protein [Legionella nagasakiensis]|uniref:hypothetical protein n=1 Tax=Legionella nagasakiensis TaxID=535290 RepID=UPI001055ED33|nr:hypothetical protein [Legionella nagasakiensis]